MKLRLALVLGLVCTSAVGQGWTVKPEWVRAHEEFLASDVMAGRGSATRDEEIAATYVASEFMGYGLKTAPGMTGYLQGAEVVAPVLDGKASVTAGKVMLGEGKDFYLLMSSGSAASGGLRKVSAGDVAKAQGTGAVVLLTGDAEAVAKAMRRVRGAAAVLVEESKGTDALVSMFGGKTRTPIGLKDGASRQSATYVILKKGAFAAMQALADGTAVAVGVHTVPQETARKTFNAIGYLEGTDPASGTILLTSHLDHLGVGKAVHGDGIFNGANDDAAGTTAVLELAHALAAGPRMKRSVLFVCYGSEEIGGLGSTFFGEHPPVPLTSLVANLEFEMIGSQDPKMAKGVLLLTGWERSNLGPTLKEHGALLGPDPYPEEHFFERSDNYSLALKGVVAHTAAGWGTVPTYHQVNDDVAHLDIGFMTAAIQSLVEPMRWLASSDFKPSWNKDGQPKGRE